MKRLGIVTVSLALMVGACHPSAQLSEPRVPDLRAPDLMRDASLYPKYHQLCATLNNGDITHLEASRCVSLEAQKRVVDSQAKLRADGF